MMTIERPRPGRPAKTANSYPELPYPDRPLTDEEIDKLGEAIATHLLRLGMGRRRGGRVENPFRTKRRDQHEYSHEFE